MKARILATVLLIVGLGFSQACADLLIFKDKSTAQATVLEFFDGKFKIRLEGEIAIKLCDAKDFKRIYFIAEAPKVKPARELIGDLSEPLPDEEGETQEAADKIRSLKKSQLLEQSDSLYHEGWSSYLSDDYKSAIELFKKAQKYLRKLIHETKDREIKERYEAKHQKIESFIEKARDKQVDSFYWEGKSCYYNKDYKSAINYFERAQKYLRKFIRETEDKETKTNRKSKYQAIESFIKKTRKKQNERR